jgi:release factor glutamine methyltransferase
MNKMHALRYFCPDIIVWNPPYLPSDEEMKLFSNEDKSMLIGGRKGYEEAYELLEYLKQNGIKTNFYTLFSSLAWDKSKLNELEKQGFSIQIIGEKKIFFEKLYAIKSKISDSDV